MRRWGVTGLRPANFTRLWGSEKHTSACYPIGLVLAWVPGPWSGCGRHGLQNSRMLRQVKWE